MQLRLGQTWEWPGTHSVSRGCPCACLCQSPNGKTALPWSPGRTSARLQTPAPQSPRWKHAACCGGRGREEEEEEVGRKGKEGKEGVTVQQYNDLHTHLRLPPFSLFHTTSCVSVSVYQQSLPLLMSQMKSNARWVRARPPLDSPNPKDVRLGTTWKRGLFDSMLAQPHTVVSAVDTSTPASVPGNLPWLGDGPESGGMSQ